MKGNSKSLKKSNIRSVVTNISLSFIIFLIFLGGLEGILRITHLFGARISWSEPDPVLGYRFTPGRKYWSNEENDHPITGRINSYGYRDKEWSLKKPPNTYRIAVLGDSFVEAFQVETDCTFLALTEKQLNRNHNIKVELMNFGRSGFTQTEELLVLKKEVVQFSPDMVILFFLPGNDIEDVSRETAPDLMRPFYHISESGELILDTSFVEMREFKLKCFINWFKQHSAMISLLCERYNLYKKQKRSKAKSGANAKGGEISPKKLAGYLSLCTDNADSAYVRNYKHNKILIKAIAEYCKDKGIQFMLITINNNAYIPEVDNKYKLIDPTFNPNFFEDDLGNFTQSINVEYLGLQRKFREYYENRGVFLHWGHWNYEGHRVVANALTDKLSSIFRVLCPRRNHKVLSHEIP